MLKKVFVTMLVLILLIGSINVTAKEKKSSQMIKGIAEFINGFVCIFKQLDEDTEYMAQVIYHENWHTDKEHKAAYYTGAVVNNRRIHKDKWLHSTGDGSVKDVLYAKGQYSTTRKFFTVEIPQECYDMARDIILNGTPDVPENVIYQATFKQGSGDWIPPINGEHFCYE